MNFLIAASKKQRVDEAGKAVDVDGKESKQEEGFACWKTSISFSLLLQARFKSTFHRRTRTIGCMTTTNKVKIIVRANLSWDAGSTSLSNASPSTRSRQQFLGVDGEDMTDEHSVEDDE